MKIKQDFSLSQGTLFGKVGTVGASKARDRMNPVSLKVTKFSMQKFERFSKVTKFLCA